MGMPATGTRVSATSPAIAVNEGASSVVTSAGYSWGGSGGNGEWA